MRISACVICRNEAGKISSCLDSVAWCDDIVVVDSGSTDGTVEKAAAHKTQPRIIHHDWTGYNQQRQFAVDQCRHEWVLALDADEECSSELAAEIQSLPDTRTSGIAMFAIPRKNFIAHRWVRCWSPDYQTRLIHQQRVIWDDTSAPEIRRPQSGFSTQKLAGPLLHNRLSPYSITDINDGPRMAEHATILAQSLHARGRHATMAALLFRPALTFLKYYIFRGGFLQGRFGLVICYKTTIGVMLKYSVLYATDVLPQQTEPQARNR
ncbi:MAG: glycosyltransferase family 2 protein [Phycisphaerae bacterium]